MPYWMLVVKPRNFVREEFQVVSLMQQSTPPVPDKNVITLSMFRLQLQAARSVTTHSPQPQKSIFNYLNTIWVIVTVSDQNKGKVSESCFLFDHICSLIVSG